MDGTGYDVKLGVIVRPIEASPFRIGGYVNSPIFYDLDTRGTADLAHGGSGSCHHACPCAGDRLRLHRRGTPDHRRGRPCGSLPPLCGRILRIIREVTFKQYSYETGKTFLPEKLPLLQEGVALHRRGQGGAPRAGCCRDRDDRGVGTARAGRHVRLLLRADILCRRREGARRRGLSLRWAAARRFLPM